MNGKERLLSNVVVLGVLSLDRINVDNENRDSATKFFNASQLVQETHHFGWKTSVN